MKKKTIQRIYLFRKDVLEDELKQAFHDVGFNPLKWDIRFVEEHWELEAHEEYDLNSLKDLSKILKSPLLEVSLYDSRALVLHLIDEENDFYLSTGEIEYRLHAMKTKYSAFDPYLLPHQVHAFRFAMRQIYLDYEECLKKVLSCFGFTYKE